MTKRAVIHRDRTVIYRGQTYKVRQGSDRPERDGSRSLVLINSDDPGDETTVYDGFGYLSEVRTYVERATAEDWPDLFGPA